MLSYLVDKVLYLIGFLKFAFYGFYLLLHELEIGTKLKRTLPFLKGKHDAKGKLDKTSKKLTTILNETLKDFHDQQNTTVSDKQFWCIVTGANSGIGFETTQVLVANGYNVIMACRSIERAQEAKSKIELYLKENSSEIVTHGKLEIMQCDISDLESVKQFADKVINSGYSVNRLLNNAGCMLNQFTLTKQKFEIQLASNYLGPLLLQLLLLDTLKKNGPSRIINVASAAHHGGSVDLAKINPQNENEYSPMDGYTQSKSLNIMGTYLFHKHLKEIDVKNVTVNALHPGIIYTNIGSNMWPLFNFLFNLFVKTLAYTPLEGAVNSLFLTLSPEVEQVSGKYFEYCTPTMSSSYTYDLRLQEELWNTSMNYLKEYL
jgi:retinol dehydrogenase-12